jgi:hypothetical protein
MLAMQPIRSSFNYLSKSSSQEQDKSDGSYGDVDAHAGATPTVPLGNRGPTDDNKEYDDFDPEIDVYWG